MNFGFKLDENFDYLGHFKSDSILSQGHNKMSKKQAKVKKVMHEYKHGQLRSGSKHGPKVKSRKQAIAIAMSESGQSYR